MVMIMIMVMIMVTWNKLDILQSVYTIYTCIQVYTIENISKNTRSLLFLVNNIEFIYPVTLPLLI